MKGKAKCLHKSHILTIIEFHFVSGHCSSVSITRCIIMFRLFGLDSVCDCGCADKLLYVQWPRCLQLAFLAIRLLFSWFAFGRIHLPPRGNRSIEMCRDNRFKLVLSLLCACCQASAHTGSKAWQDVCVGPATVQGVSLTCSSQVLLFCQFLEDVNFPLLFAADNETLFIITAPLFSFCVTLLLCLFCKWGIFPKMLILSWKLHLVFIYIYMILTVAAHICT